MSSKIRVLSDHTINKIAAGEVIENPASVVKELVENSIDADSTDICVEIKGGGRQLIRITDNGFGMNRDDAVLCLERHATSKLRDVEDIHSLATMGFRGEAIPSIASISKFNLLTNHANPSNEEHHTSGTMVIVDGGRLVSCSPAARSQGTTIEVKSLFFNVPVRKKFLKSPVVDANEILKTVSLIALGHPHIKFQLVSEGKSLLSTSLPDKSLPFNDQLKSRISDVLGKEFVESINFIDTEANQLTLQGGVGLPGYTRHNRSAQYLFINKRAVVSPLVSFAVREGFGTAIPTGRFPAFILHLTLPGNWVDVNVHPQKKEVRLRQEQLIKDLIINGVRNTLRSPFSTREEPAPSPCFFVQPSSPWNPSPSVCEDVPCVWESGKKKSQEPLGTYHPFEYSRDYPQGEQFLPKQTVIPTPQTPPDRPQPATLPFPPAAAPQPKIIATLPGYVVVESHNIHPLIAKGSLLPGQEGLLIVDQKNAHARIIFEKLSLSAANAPVAQQTLLIPRTIELSPYESRTLHRVLPMLNKMGLHISEFGSNTFVIDAIPRVFGNNDIDRLINDILHDLRSRQESSMDEQAAENEQAKQLAHAASKAAVSSNRKLSLEEANTLLAQLLACNTPYRCPSGKPTFIQFSLDDLAKLFQK